MKKLTAFVITAMCALSIAGSAFAQAVPNTLWLQDYGGTGKRLYLQAPSGLTGTNVSLTFPTTMANGNLIVSSPGAIQTVNYGFDIQAPSSPAGNLLNITNNAATTSYMNISATGNASIGTASAQSTAIGETGTGNNSKTDIESGTGSTGVYINNSATSGATVVGNASNGSTISVSTSSTAVNAIGLNGNTEITGGTTHPALTLLQNGASDIFDVNAGSGVVAKFDANGGLSVAPTANGEVTATLTGTTGTGTPDILDVNNSAASKVDYIDNSGNVVIGVSSVFAPLTVLQTGGNQVLLGGGSNTGAEIKFLNQTAHMSIYNTAGSLVFANTSHLSQTNTLLNGASASGTLMTLSGNGGLTVDGGTSSAITSGDITANAGKLEVGGGTTTYEASFAPSASQTANTDYILPVAIPATTPTGSAMAMTTSTPGTTGTLSWTAVPRGSIQSGTVTMVSGGGTGPSSVTISAGVAITASSKIVVLVNTPGTSGPGVYDVPAASRTNGAPGTGAFTIYSSNMTDTSTLDYVIIN